MPIQQITRVYARQPIFGVVVTPSHSIKTTENKKIMIKRSRFFITKRAIIDYSDQGLETFSFLSFPQIDQLFRNTKIIFGLVLKGPKLGKYVFQSVQFNRRKNSEIDIVGDILTMTECARLGS
jgi:hypothetical protein